MLKAGPRLIRQQPRIGTHPWADDNGIPYILQHSRSQENKEKEEAGAGGKDLLKTRRTLRLSSASYILSV